MKRCLEGGGANRLEDSVDSCLRQGEPAGRQTRIQPQLCFNWLSDVSQVTELPGSQVSHLLN